MIRMHLVLNGLLLLAAGRLLAQVPGQAFDPTQAWAQVQQQLLQQFDQNKDGKLTGAEQIAAQEYLRKQGVNVGMPPGGFPGADQFNKQFDKNRDGKLDPAERAAAAAAYNRMRGGKGGGGVQKGVVPGPQYDPGTPAEPKDKVPPLIKRFDKDGDGKLNAAEKAAAQAEFKKSKNKDAKEKDAKERDDKAKDAKDAKD